jgi:4-amino-4-deoxy-L-arabinose transferase-like glycosyltransferase
MSPRRLSWQDALVALGLGGGYATWLLRTLNDLGYARDEGFYFQASASYARWFEQLFAAPRAALARSAVDGAWGANHEHPALVKSLFALSGAFLQKRWHLFAMEGTSYRFPAIVLAGVAVAVIYLWGAEARGRTAGAMAALLFAAMPRVFFHAHLACFDVPIVTMWTLGAYAYWRALRRGGVLAPLAAGVAFGLALDTKHNSWFLPIACAAHFLALQVWAALAARTRLLPRAVDAAVVRRRALAALVAMGLVGPLVLVGLWPWVWHDTVRRLSDYVLFHLNHEYYNMEFLGVNYWAAPMPRGYAWLMTLATVPGVTLLLFAVGVAGRARAWVVKAKSVDAAGTDLLWLIALVVNYAAWLSPRTPIFGGTKHWLTAYPFLALFAGVGFDMVVRAARRELLRLRRRSEAARRAGRSAIAAPLLLGAAVLAAPFTETVRSHPWGLSAYTPLVGGAAGAASLGLNRTFWGYATGAVAGYLDERAPRGASVYIHDTAGPSWDMLVRDGRIRKDIRGVGSIVGADYGLYQHEKHMLGQEYQTWVAFGTLRPAHIGGLDGVPVILVYEDPRVTRAHSQKP